MIVAIAAYIAGFGLAWGPVVAHGFPWTLALLICPGVWIAAVIRGRGGALAPGLYAVVAVAAWAATMEALLPALGAVVLAIVAWDAAGLELWMRKANEVPDRPKIWRAMLLRSSGIAAAGAGVALVFSQLELSLPFWGLVALLVVTWASLAVLNRRNARRSHSAPPHTSADRSYPQ
ncbi:MAG: hypothetical protein ACNA7X_03680 [Dehalococcoidia bacterium]